MSITWLTVLANTYLSLSRVIAGDTGQFKATLLILQDSRIHSVLSLLQVIAGDTRHFMAIFQHQSQPNPNCYSRGNAVEIPHLSHLTMPRLRVAEVDDEESRQSPQHPHDH